MRPLHKIEHVLIWILISLPVVAVLYSLGQGRDAAE